MIGAVQRWWHRAVRGHSIDLRRVTVPVWDRNARGRLWRCSCGTTWAD